MARRSIVVVTYQPCPGEAFEVRIEGANDYPDALDQARAQAVRALDESIGVVFARYRGLADDVTTDAEFDALVSGEGEDEPDE